MMLLLLAAAVTIPMGLDLYMPVPEDNPLSRLSRDQTVSCSSCHDPRRAFADHRPVAVGVFGRRGRRNAPALINRGYGQAFFWDGRVRSLEEQVLKPIQDPNEMDLTVDEAARRVGLAPEEMARALASYVRSILSGGSPTKAPERASSRRRRCARSPEARRTCTTAACPRSKRSSSFTTAAAGRIRGWIRTSGP